MHYGEAIVWQKAILAARKIYRLAPRLPMQETYGMRSQITLAAVLDKLGPGPNGTNLR